MTLRYCKAQGCSTLVESGFCDKHKNRERQTDKEYNRTRPSPSRRGYGRQWEKVRKMYLARHPICEECERYGMVELARIVHHIDQDPYNNEFDNLQALCLSCHNKVHGKGE